MGVGEEVVLGGEFVEGEQFGVEGVLAGELG